MNVRAARRNGGCTAEVCYVGGKVEIVSSSYAEAESAVADFVEVRAPTRSENAWWILAGVGVAAFLVQAAATDAYYTTLTKIYSGLLAAVTAVALARILVVKPPRVPMVEYSLTLHYLAFGLAATAGPTPAGVWGSIPTPDAYESAAALALACAVSLLTAHAIWNLSPTKTTRRRYMPNLTADSLYAASGPYVLFTAAFVVLCAVVPAVRVRLASVLGVANMFFDIVPLATVATLAYVLRPRAKTFVQLVSALSSSAIVMGVTSMVSAGMMAVTATAAVWWRIRGRIPILLSVSGVAIFIILQPVKFYYREIMWSGHAGGVSVVTGWQQAFDNALADRYAESGGDATRARLSDLGTLAYVIDLVPRAVPYLGGDVYEQTAIAAIPRIFWPGKPNMTKAGLDRYVIELGISSPEIAEQSTTGIQLTAHGYASHGVLGAILWTFLFGFAIGAVDRFFGRGISGTLAMTSFMVGWGGTMGVGFVNCFGSLWQLVGGTMALTWTLSILGSAVQSRRDLRFRATVRAR